MTESVTCGDCGSPMQLRSSRFGKFWSCSKWPACKGKHGAYPDGRPLGIPADEETRRARIVAHQALEVWADRHGLERREVYRWLEENAPKPHIAEMTSAECAELVYALAAATLK